jgi:hypothetical protein
LIRREKDMDNMSFTEVNGVFTEWLDEFTESPEEVKEFHEFVEQALRIACDYKIACLKEEAEEGDED